LKEEDELAVTKLLRKIKRSSYRLVILIGLETSNIPLNIEHLVSSIKKHIAIFKINNMCIVD
jgi:hypothetical protein